ncbi:hypothetical protein BDQ17DRAFT_132056 [Cyathus striatus]|nr:hypothetical protein BDQ17DRAFT_132056 [Cyathus striatus]
MWFNLILSFQISPLTHSRNYKYIICRKFDFTIIINRGPTCIIQAKHRLFYLCMGGGEKKEVRAPFPVDSQRPVSKCKGQKLEFRPFPCYIQHSHCHLGIFNSNSTLHSVFS